MLLFVACSLHAELVAIPALKTHVTDLTQTLTTEEQSQLDAKLMAFEQQKGSQIAVLIVPTTEPEAIEQYSIRVVDVWKLGRKKVDDGVLILIAKNDRKMRIEVGYGLEGAIPDLYAKRVIDEVMKPKFKQGDYFGGINSAVDTIIGMVSGEALSPATNAPPSGNNSSPAPLGIIFFAVIVGAILRVMLGGFRAGLITGGIAGILIWLFTGALVVGVISAIGVFIATLIGITNFTSGGRGFGGGTSGGSSWGGGGGGGFGGGGASGDW
jgi:uncharacterized protein